MSKRRIADDDLVRLLKEDAQKHPPCPNCGRWREDTDEALTKTGWRCAGCGAWAEPKAGKSDSGGSSTVHDNKLLWEERAHVPWYFWRESAK
jgi:ribosomal protein L37AE/L43A